MSHITKAEGSSGFGNIFGGYCIIHASELSPERRAGFEREFKRVGITRYHVVEPEVVAEDDPRLAFYKGWPNPRASLSLVLSHIKCLGLARQNGWDSVVICEDDVCFRAQFPQMWQEVEGKVLETKWDILYLYFWYSRFREPRGPVSLKPINDTFCTHCFVVQAACFEPMEEAFSHLIELGLHPDHWHLHHRLIKQGKVILSTTKNLAGQSGGLISFTNDKKFAQTNFVEDAFNIWNPNPLGTVAWFITKSLPRLRAYLFAAVQWVRNKASA